MSDTTMPLCDLIRPGSNVTIATPHGRLMTGRAVMRGPAGWVLNMGGLYGTPKIASDANVVKVRTPTEGRRRKRKDI